MDRITISAAIVLSLVAPGDAIADDGADSKELSTFARELLGASESDLKRLSPSARQDLIDLAPVNLPTAPPGDCNHYGWPVATISGDTIVVMHRRIPGHRANGAGGASSKDVLRRRASQR